MVSDEVNSLQMEYSYYKVSNMPTVKVKDEMGLMHRGRFARKVLQYPYSDAKLE